MTTSESGENWIQFDGRRYFLAPGESAMESLLRGGADVSFSCRKGSCWTCLLQAESGKPDPAAQASLTQEMRDNRLFLPCVARDMREVVARRADLSQLFVSALVTEKTQLAPGIWRLLLELPETFRWLPGQYVRLRNPAGDVRSYSIASIAEEDYLVELHIRHYRGGKISAWIADELAPGDVVSLRGPAGHCVYSEADPDRSLLFLGTGTGAAPLIGIARDALRKGHRGPIHFYHGAAMEADLYLRERLQDMEAAHANFTSHCAASREGERRRIVELAFANHPDLTDFSLYVAGHPKHVEAACIGALTRGAQRDRIHADPFASEEPYQPQDEEKIDAISADPELWAALDQGRKLHAILARFYDRVFEDQLLAPFFHRITKTRAIEKQYEFLADLFTGTRGYFGNPPFNAHHWMVVSDELFDYRERLFFQVVREFGLRERLIARWAGLHETFRREIVKTAPRGLFVDGTEICLEGFTTESVTVDSLCDGCGEEIRSGHIARLHRRTGELFCERCEGSPVA